MMNEGRSSLGVGRGHTLCLLNVLGLVIVVERGHYVDPLLFCACSLLCTQLGAQIVY